MNRRTLAWRPNENEQVALAVPARDEIASVSPTGICERVHAPFALVRLVLLHERDDVVLVDLHTWMSGDQRASSRSAELLSRTSSMPLHGPRRAPKSAASLWKWSLAARGNAEDDGVGAVIEGDWQPAPPAWVSPAEREGSMTAIMVAISVSWRT